MKVGKLTQMFLACGSAGTSVWERNHYRLDSGYLLFTGWRKLMLATAQPLPTSST